MKPENKQRIIGIIVLVAFIALLIPFLFTSGIKKKSPTVDDKTSQKIDTQITTEKTTTMPFIENIQQNEQSIPNNYTTLENKNTQPIENNKIVQQESVKQTPTNNNIKTLLEMPDVSPMTLNSSDLKTLEQEKQVKQLPNKQKNAKKQTVAKKPTVNKQKKAVTIGKKGFWSVQIGSFSDKDRINKIVLELQSKGYHVFIQNITTSTGSLTRILVGHEDTREKAAKIANQIEATIKIKGHLVRNNK